MVRFNVRALIATSDELLSRFLDYVAAQGLELYPAQEEALLELVQALRIPVFLNGLARGCVAADHELYFSRARSQGLKDADVALVVGVPMDFRLGFGAAFGEDTRIVVTEIGNRSVGMVVDSVSEVFSNLLANRCRSFEPCRSA